MLLYALPWYIVAGPRREWEKLRLVLASGLDFHALTPGQRRAE